MMADLEQYVPRAARNEIFYFVARVCMIGASVIGLPIAGAIGSRIIAQNDRLSETVQELSTTQKLLSYQLADKLEIVGKQLADHEIRIRGLERRAN